MLPLFIISTLLCTHSFIRKTLRTSLWGSSLAVTVAIGYSVFHLQSAQQKATNDDASKTDTNAVTAIIDSYNRYSGFCGFAVIVIASIIVQENIVDVIRMLEHVDVVFAQDYALHVDNVSWIMWVGLMWFLFERSETDFFPCSRVMVQWFALIGIYTSLELANCLMYIRDAAPLVDSFYKCYIMCLGIFWEFITHSVQRTRAILFSSISRFF